MIPFYQIMPAIIQPEKNFIYYVKCHLQLIQKIVYLYTNACDCPRVSRRVRSVNLGDAEALPSLGGLGLHVPVGVTQDDLADIGGVILEVDEGDGVGLVVVAPLVSEVRRGKLRSVLRALLDLNIPALFLIQEEIILKR